MGSIPQSLISFEVFDEVIALLLENDCLRRRIKTRDFGKRVVSEDEAYELLAKISSITKEMLGIAAAEFKDPELKLTRMYRTLPRKVMTVLLIFTTLGIALMYGTLQYPNNDAAIWVVRGAIIFLMVFPLIFYRRVKLNIEHDCKYTRYPDGKASISIDQLSAVQFQSYLCHEYAHHVYYEYFGRAEETWRSEGWSRLVQWEVVRLLAEKEENHAYLYHIAVQCVGELKMACEILSLLLHVRVPSRVRRIRTIYRNNPLLNFIMGSPGFDVHSLIDHGIGTAVYFVARRRLGLRETLWKLSELRDEDFHCEMKKHRAIVPW